MVRAILRPSMLVVCVLFFVLAGVTVGGAQVPVWTWHYDNARSGANSSETILTPLNVNFNQFGKLFTQPVDGLVIGQALYLPGVTIPGNGVHNVVYVATMHDSVYAFDADSATGPNQNPLWHTSFLINGATTVPIALQGCGDTTAWTEVGIVSTPVIDTATGTLYVVAKTYENSTFVHRLHALNVATGLEQAGSPIVITASYEPPGSDTTYTFEPAMQVNRPALLLEKGNIYIAIGSNGCRGGKEQGWVVAYNAATLQPEGAFDDEPGESAAAVWMRGGGLSSDSFGYIYGATADGPFAAGLDFGQSVFKLSGSTLSLTDWFTPFNEALLDEGDLDMSEPVLILPNQPGKYPHLALAVGKEGTIYVLNRDNMGHFCATCTQVDNQIVQELTAFSPEPGAMIYWNNTVYTTGVATSIDALALSRGKLALTPFAFSKKTANGHSPVLSANGKTDGILWQLNGTYLCAYDALTLDKIYGSSEAPNGRDLIPALPHFANMVVANGKLYVGTNNSVIAFGLLQ